MLGMDFLQLLNDLFGINREDAAFVILCAVPVLILITVILVDIHKRNCY